jgi:hypothetical protein
MPSETPPDQRREPEYEPPRVVDLGTFAELTQHRAIARVTDNATNFGTR